MKSNASAWMVAGAVSAAAAVGITTAMMQTSKSPVPVSSATPTPAAIASASPGATPLSQPPVSQSTPSAGAGTTAPSSQTSSSPPSDSASSGSRIVESCKTRMAIVKDPEPPLNVRSAPSTETGKVVGQLQNGTMVMVEAEQNGWYQITSPQTGWIAKQRTESGCNEKVERVQSGTQTISTLIQDRFIGTGSHAYKFQAKTGQVITITRQSGPFPTVQAPDGTYLIDSRDENRPAWTQTLPQTGTYSIQLDSNYKGYPYSFQVEIR